VGKLYWWRRPFQGFLMTRSVTDLWEWLGAGLLIKVSDSLTFLSMNYVLEYLKVWIINFLWYWFQLIDKLWSKWKLNEC
jgi:hypothetical protein